MAEDKSSYSNGDREYYYLEGLTWQGSIQDKHRQDRPSTSEEGAGFAWWQVSKEFSGLPESASAQDHEYAQALALEGEPRLSISDLRQKVWMRVSP